MIKRYLELRHDYPDRNYNFIVGFYNPFNLSQGSIKKLRIRIPLLLALIIFHLLGLKD